MAKRLPYLRLVGKDKAWDDYVQAYQATEKHNRGVARLMFFLAIAGWLAILGWAAVSSG